MANYSIIGSDGKEYGPVPVDELRKWIAAGRVGPQTQVRAEGATEWRLLADLPELADLPKTSPPPLPIRPLPTPEKTSVMAILSLVFGILGCTALFGLVLGIIALVRISNSSGALRGKGLALAGTIVSGVFVLMIPVFVALLLPALAAAKGKANEITCISNEKQLGLAMRMYSSENTNHFPPATTWCDAIQKSVGSNKVFKCPAVNGSIESNHCDYAFNTKLDGVDENKINPQTVMIFESDAGWNAHGGPELLASHRHSRNKLIVTFADGSVQLVSEQQLSTLRWDP